MSFEPHFVALFDAQNQLVASEKWTDFRAGGEIVWGFLETYKIGQALDLTFIGGVSGPGGFSTLRVGGAIINALGFRFGLPVYQVRADYIARELIGSDEFLLNSFGDGVFVPEGDDLIRMPFTEVDNKEPLFVDWLPAEKKSKFKILKSNKDVMATTLSVLQAQDSKKVFLPDYEFPAVQKN